MKPKQPKFKIGDTVVLKMRWFLWFKEYVLCEIVGAVYYGREMPKGLSTWRYTLKIGNQFKRFLRWESELFFHKENQEDCEARGGKFRRDVDEIGYCKFPNQDKEYIYQFKK